MDELNIGNKLQGYRRMRNINIRELSEKCGVTASMLSQIERGLVNPSINTLKIISKALEVPLFLFFKDDEITKELVVRCDKRKTIGRPEDEDTVYDLLTPDVSGSIEFCMMHVPPRKNSAEAAQSHNGEEVAFVMNGQVDIQIDSVIYTLKAGDSIRIPPLCEHMWLNHGEQEVQVIFAVTPPSF